MLLVPARDLVTRVADTVQAAFTTRKVGLMAVAPASGRLPHAHSSKHTGGSIRADLRAG